MNISSVNAGDIVRVDKKGRRFLAFVDGRDNGGLAVTPVNRHETYRTASAREVIGIWRASSATRREVTE